MKRNALLMSLALGALASIAGCTNIPPTKPANGYYPQHPDNGTIPDSESPSVPPTPGSGSQDHTPSRVTNTDTGIAPPGRPITDADMTPPSTAPSTLPAAPQYGATRP